MVTRCLSPSTLSCLLLEPSRSHEVHSSLFTGHEFFPLTCRILCTYSITHTVSVGRTLTVLCDCHCPVPVFSSPQTETSPLNTPRLPSLAAGAALLFSISVKLSVPGTSCEPVTRPFVSALLYRAHCPQGHPCCTVCWTSTSFSCACILKKI